MSHAPSSTDSRAGNASQDPRLVLNSVTARVFPLKASMNQLQDFCDNYLNFMDEGRNNRPTHYFKPAMPWVYCEVLNYGQMSTATQNRGWIAQHEVFFLVPLAWYVIEKGELVFKDWAMVCPFVFVDNDISLQTGREIYGWVKARAWLDRLDPNWADDPGTPRLLMDMRTQVFPRAYAGERLQPRTLLQIAQNPPPSVFRDPFGKQDLLGPAWSIPDAVRTSIGYVKDAFEFFSAFPFRGYDARSIPTTGKMQAHNLKELNRFLPWWQLNRDTELQADARAQSRARNYYLNQITLKQFRDAAEPKYACYQALVNSRITVDHYYDGGLLGAPNVALGDLTGGIRLLLHEYPDQPIQSILGLEVSEWRQAEDNHRLAVLTPQFPFWATYDLRYDNGDTLCWRTKRSKWNCDPCPPSLRRDSCESVQHDPGRRGPGAIRQVRVSRRLGSRLPARSRPSRSCKKYCDDNLNRLGDLEDGPSGTTNVRDRFEAWGEFVYMLVITHSNEDSVSFSEHNNVGPTAGDQIAFYFPVKWYRDEASPQGISAGSDSGLFKLGVVAPYVFGNGRQVVSEREVNGIPSMFGDVEGGPDVWLNTFRGKERSVLAKLSATFITALDAGQPARKETLVEVVDVPGLVLAQIEHDLVTKGALNFIKKLFGCGSRWVMYGIRRVKCLFFCVLTHCHQPAFLGYIKEYALNQVSLKQVRATSAEAGRPAAYPFSYQALVLVTKKVRRLFAGVFWVDSANWGCQRFAERIDANIRIDIHYHESMDIAGILGLRKRQRRVSARLDADQGISSA